MSVVGELDIPVDLADDRVPVGGLSGLAYDPACDLFYAVSDDRGYLAPPRVHVFRLDADVPSVRPVEVITLRDRDGRGFARGVLDPESISMTPEGILWIGTEGEAHQAVPPRILGFRLDGALVDELDVPPAYHPGEGVGVRSNHGFEGLSVSPDGSRIFAAVESALVQDGEEADLGRGTTVRLVVFDADSRRVVAERAYRVEPVPDEPSPPDAYRSIGVSEILALDNRRIVVVERSFSAGVGNTVRMYLADLETGDDATGRVSLTAGHRPVKKTLIADLEDLGVDPDNLEGLSFGPVLPDGRRTVVLIADNNFQPEVQRNQLLVLAVDGVDPPELDRAPASITGIQGADHVSPLVGRCVIDVEGTVTAILGQRNGQAFWIQGPPDGDPKSSDGLFVTALGGLDRVEVGDGVRLTGRVEEPVWRMELPVTRLVADGLEIVGRDLVLPAPVVMGREGRAIPTPNIDDDGLTVFEPDRDAIDFFESLEGMRVRVDNAVVVGPTSGYGEITVLGDDGVDVHPRSHRGGVVIQPENSHPERVIIDDRLVADPPPAAVGDRLSGGIDGVLHYSYGSFKLLNTAPLEVEASPTAVTTVAAFGADEDHITVATFNVENLHAGSDESKLAAIAEIVVGRMGSPTILALQEIQDDTGPDDDGVVGAGKTLGRLVETITQTGGPRYEWAQIDPVNNADGGRPGANIRVALLFDPMRVGVVSAADTRLVANPTLLGSDDDAFTDSRKPLVVELEVDGQPLTVVVCHLRSKGGDDPLFGARQPPVLSSETQRRAQTDIVRAFLELRLSLDPSERIVVLGDLNDFEFRPPVETLAAEPMVNLMERLPQVDRWTYVYQGNSQVLDHIIVSPALANGAEIEVLHLNSSAPATERPSDHDPVIARFRFR
ncbi:MAG: esterase-like activity of phytase family protein [Candidatus Sulfomarinibacteraceae bacterium]